jgi:hypothetical protein
MTSEADGGWYWALDVPGLTAAQAEELRSFIADSGMSEFASAVDPNAFLTLHLDRSTVSSLLQAIAGSTPGSSNEAVLHAGVVEAMTEWLERSAR